MSSDILSLYIILCIEFKIKRERERHIVSSFFSRKLNSSHRKFDKSFSSLKFSSLCSSRSHYLPVVTFKLFFSFNCLILPFSISWKIYSDPPGQSMQFCIKERNERERERERGDAHHRVRPEGILQLNQNPPAGNQPTEIKNLLRSLQNFRRSFTQPEVLCSSQLCF